jgi:hypothetical protein
MLVDKVRHWLASDRTELVPATAVWSCAATPCHQWIQVDSERIGQTVQIGADPQEPVLTRPPFEDLGTESRGPAHSRRLTG